MDRCSVHLHEGELVSGVSAERVQAVGRGGDSVYQT